MAAYPSCGPGGRGDPGGQHEPYDHGGHRGGRHSGFMCPPPVPTLSTLPAQHEAAPILGHRRAAMGLHHQPASSATRSSSPPSGPATPTSTSPPQQQPPESAPAPAPSAAKEAPFVFVAPLQAGDEEDASDCRRTRPAPHRVRRLGTIGDKLIRRDKQFPELVDNAGNMFHYDISFSAPRGAQVKLIEAPPPLSQMHVIFCARENGASQIDQLKYHDSGREKTCAPSIGQWNMINKKMINGGIIDNWTCLNFSRMRPEVQRFCMDLTHMCNATGMNVNPRPFVEVKSAAPNHIEKALRDVQRRATQMLAQQGTGNQLQLLIVILPEVSGSYGKIKRICEIDIGIVSQCCLPKHASRPNKQYLENVALKINVKVGGRNTVLERAFVRNGIPFVSEVPTIIFGADVTHPPPGEDSASSIAAVVASMDWPEITKYRGLVSAQPHRQEIIEDLFTVSKDPQKGHNINGGMIRIPTDEKGTRKTVMEYFLDRYGCKLKYPCWPCLQAGNGSSPVYLPMEVCKIAEGQRYSKKFNDSQVTNTLMTIRKPPQEKREHIIHDLVLHNKSSKDRFAQEFGIKASSDPLPPPVSVVPTPPLLQDCGRERTQQLPSDPLSYNLVNLIKKLTVTINPKLKSRKALSIKKKAREIKKKVLYELKKTSLGDKLISYNGKESSRPGSEELKRNEKESHTRCDVRKVFKDISSDISRKLMKCSSKDDTWRHNFPHLLHEIIICRPLSTFFYVPLDLILGGGQARFDRWLLPPELRNPYLHPSTARVTFLNSFSRYIIHQLLVCVCREGHEALGITWDGAFTLADIWLCNGGITINPNVPCRGYDADGGRADYEALRNIISTGFYDFYSRRYPLYLSSLIYELETCPEERRQQHGFVTYLVNHPALLSYMDRMSIYTATGTMTRQLLPHHRQILQTMLNIPEYDSWGLAVEPVPDLRATYYFGGVAQYGESLDSCLKFGRNYLSHFATRSLKNAEAALALHLEFLLPCVLRVMVLDFQGPPELDILSVLDNTNGDRVTVLF